MNILPKKNKKELTSPQVGFCGHSTWGQVMFCHEWIRKENRFRFFCLDFRISDKVLWTLLQNKQTNKKPPWDTEPNSHPGSDYVILGNSPNLSGFRFFYKIGNYYHLLSYAEVDVKTQWDRISQNVFNNWSVQQIQAVYYLFKITVKIVTVLTMHYCLLIERYSVACSKRGPLQSLSYTHHCYYFLHISKDQHVHVDGTRAIFLQLNLQGTMTSCCVKSLGSLNTWKIFCALKKEAVQGSGCF